MSQVRKRGNGVSGREHNILKDSEPQNNTVSGNGQFGGMKTGLGVGWLQVLEAAGTRLWRAAQGRVRNQDLPGR